jgi:hypothetical protein
MDEQAQMHAFVFEPPLCAKHAAHQCNTDVKQMPIFDPLSQGATPEIHRELAFD